MVRPEGGSAGASGPGGAMAGGPTRVSCHRLLAFLTGCVTFKIKVNTATPATGEYFYLAFYLFLEECSLLEVEVF